MALQDSCAHDVHCNMLVVMFSAWLLLFLGCALFAAADTCTAATAAATTPGVPCCHLAHHTEDTTASMQQGAATQMTKHATSCSLEPLTRPNCCCSPWARTAASLLRPGASTVGLAARHACELNPESVFFVCSSMRRKVLQDKDCKAKSTILADARRPFQHK